MELRELEESLVSDLSRSLVSPHILLDNLNMIREWDRQLSQYVDPLYMPFYYHLGKRLEVKRLIEMGFGLALNSTCFMKGCRTVQKFFAFQDKTDEYYSNKLALQNVRKVYRNEFFYHYGKLTDIEFEKRLGHCEWDLAIFNEQTGYDQHLLGFDMVWKQIAEGGYMVVDHVDSQNASKAFANFCKIQNRIPIIIKTRYGVGIVKK